MRFVPKTSTCRKNRTHLTPTICVFNPCSFRSSSYHISHWMSPNSLAETLVWQQCPSNATWSPPVQLPLMLLWWAKTYLLDLSAVGYRPCAFQQKAYLLSYDCFGRLVLMHFYEICMNVCITLLCLFDYDEHSIYFVQIESDHSFFKLASVLHR